MHLKRATTEKLREVFNKYATHEANGELYMTSEDFVRGFLGQSYNEVSQLDDLQPSSDNVCGTKLAKFRFHFSRRNRRCYWPALRTLARTG